MYSKNTRVFECNDVPNFKQSAKNFRRFKIFGAPKGLRDTFCLYIFLNCKNTTAYQWNFLQKFKSNW